MRPVSISLPAPPGSSPAGVSGAKPSPPARETLYFRPFVLTALGSTLLGGSAIGAIFFHRTWGTLGPVPDGWKSLHGHLQIFGLFGASILGFGLHLVARFAGKGFDWPRPGRLLMALFGSGLLLRVLGDPVLRPLLPAVFAWTAPLGSLLELSAFAVFGLWVRRTLGASRGVHAPHEPLLYLGALSFALGLLADASAGALAAAGKSGEAGLFDPQLVLVSETLAFWGGIAGWVFGVILRAFPMFNPGIPSAGPVSRWVPRLLFPGCGILAASAFVPAGLARSRTIAAGLLLYHAGALLAIVLAGAFRRRKGGLKMAFDLTEALFYRYALFAATAGSLISLGLAVRAALGSPPSGLVPDAARHLFALGLFLGLLLGMMLRLVGVFEGKPLRAPHLRRPAFALLAAGLAGRFLQVGGEFGWTGAIRVASYSGYLVWLAIQLAAVCVIGTIVLPSRTGRWELGLG